MAGNKKLSPAEFEAIYKYLQAKSPQELSSIKKALELGTIGAPPGPVGPGVLVPPPAAEAAAVEEAIAQKALVPVEKAAIKKGLGKGVWGKVLGGAAGAGLLGGLIKGLSSPATSLLIPESAGEGSDFASIMDIPSPSPSPTPSPTATKSIGDSRVSNADAEVGDSRPSSLDELKAKALAKAIAEEKAGKQQAARAAALRKIKMMQFMEDTAPSEQAVDKRLQEREAIRRGLK